MRGKSAAPTPQDYIGQLAEPRRSEISALDQIIRQTAPRLSPTMEFGMLGYGRYHYKYASGREGDWMTVGLASNKNYISLYVTAMTDEQYLAESYKERLPKASIGKSCIRFKSLADLDAGVLQEMLGRAQEWYETRSD